MFSSETEYIIGKIQNTLLGSKQKVSLRSILTAPIHHSIKTFFRAEVYNRQSKFPLPKDTGPISKIVEELQLKVDLVLPTNYLFDRDTFLSILTDAVHFQFNFLCRPKWTMLEFFFQENSSITVRELKRRFLYFSAYEYYTPIVLRYLQNKNITTINRDDFEILIQKIDTLLYKNAKADDYIKLLRPFSEFIQYGRADNDPSIPEHALELFFNDKGFTDIKDNLKKAQVFLEIDKYTLKDLYDILVQFPAEKEKEITTKSEKKIFFDLSEFEQLKKEPTESETPQQIVEEPADEKPTTMDSPSIPEKEPISEIKKEKEEPIEMSSQATVSLEVEKEEPEPYEGQVEIPSVKEKQDEFESKRDTEPSGEKSIEHPPLVIEEKPSEEIPELKKEKISRKHTDDTTVESRQSELPLIERAIKEKTVNKKVKKAEEEKTIIKEKPKEEIPDTVERPILEEEVIESKLLHELEDEKIISEEEKIKEQREELKPMEKTTPVEEAKDVQDNFIEHKEQTEKFSTLTEELPPTETVEERPLPEESLETKESIKEERDAEAVDKIEEKIEKPQKPTEPPPQQISPPQLETLINNNERKRFVRRLFSGDEAYYNVIISTINNMTTWKEASLYIDELYLMNRVDPYSEESIEFTDKVYSRFAGLKKKS